jgi:putative phosphoesterase
VEARAAYTWTRNGQLTTSVSENLCRKRLSSTSSRSGALRPRSSTRRIGIISDTHGLLRPEVVERLTDLDHIIHAGDIGSFEVISGLRKIAPLTAIRGNVDKGAWAAKYPDNALVELGGRSIYVLHNLKELDLDPATAGIEVVISGHSHRPAIETDDGVLYLNPGSAGPRRFSLPVALATLELTPDVLRPRIHEFEKVPR